MNELDMVDDIESNAHWQSDEDKAEDTTEDKAEDTTEDNADTTEDKAEDIPGLMSPRPPVGIFSESEALLDMLRLNGINRGEYHGHNYLRLKNTLFYYRIPIIVFNAVNVFFASSTQSYIEKNTLYNIITVISLICGIIAGIELFLKKSAYPPKK